MAINFKVIVIDDDPITVWLHQFIVRQSELSKDPLAFLSGQQALDYLDACDHGDKPFLLLLDINMPSMNGWEVVESIASRIYWENVFVVVVSSSIDSSDRKRANVYKQVIDYLEKPIDALGLQRFKSAEWLRVQDK